MSDTSIITFYWQILVNQIGTLGLPVDKHLVAYALIAALVYGFGYVSKKVAGHD
ncbi:MAG: hypothetical protein HOP13_08735 [Alphaproteobacteria bacterium]|nr:hypothetical protein [Alphaproteobacteria bacterium]